ncbi:MAG: ArsR/SmtB family transcription factor [Candidatus Hermodarchaeota archaeon]
MDQNPDKMQPGDNQSSEVTSDPITIQLIIDALSERTRLFMLRCIEEEEYGVVATELAQKIKKKVPTVLYHLERLEQAGLIRSEMKPRVPEDSRLVKHWVLVTKRLKLNIDLKPLSYLYKDLETYISAFQRNLRKKGRLTAELISQVTAEEISRHLNVPLAFSEVIKNYLTSVKVASILAQELDTEFKEALKSKISLRMTVQDIVAKYNTDIELAVLIQNELLSTGKYAIDRLARLFLRQQS